MVDFKPGFAGETDHFNGLGQQQVVQRRVLATCGRAFTVLFQRSFKKWIQLREARIIFDQLKIASQGAFGSQFDLSD